jgi:hypothetical protein
VGLKCKDFERQHRWPNAPPAKLITATLSEAAPADRQDLVEFRYFTTEQCDKNFVGRAAILDF